MLHNVYELTLTVKYISSREKFKIRTVKESIRYQIQNTMIAIKSDHEYIGSKLLQNDKRGAFWQVFTGSTK